jgi:hypothetical protein
MAITQLGVFDADGNGLVNPHAVGLWADDGTLLGSTTIPAGIAAPLVDGYRYAPITPVLIRPGHYPLFPLSARVAAEFSAGDADDFVTPIGGGFVDPVYPQYNYSGAYTWAFFGLGAGLPFPSGGWTTGQCQPEGYGCSAPPFYEVNFQFIVVATNPTNITFVISGNTLTLTWPADHLGWILQSQTNGSSVGLATNWVNIAGSGSSTQAVVNINPANPAVFFRLRSP